jgi:hypothetical protein
MKHPLADTAARRSTPSLQSGLSLAAATLSTLCGAWLAWHYPLGAAWALGGFVLAAGIASLSRNACLWMVPALLPVIGLAPWTGWITFEEFDLLVLAVAAGGYGRRVWKGASHARHSLAPKPAISALPALPALVVLLFAASTLWAMARGFADAGGFSFGWFHGYLEPMNSVRLAKSFFLALLLLPLWQYAYRQQPVQAARAICGGMTLGLAGASLATVWERMAFTDLLNFSTDYRTTGLFWEMHVGGAALDGFLALTMPFALRELLQARTPMRWGAAAAIAALGSYACLTTFSRGVYLAVPFGVAVLFLLLWLQGRQQTGAIPPATKKAGETFDFLAAALLITAFALFAGWMFPTSGYRGAGALLGAVVLMLPLARMLQGMPPSLWMVGTVSGFLLAALALGISFAPKGAYAAYAMAFSFTALMIFARFKKWVADRVAGPMALAGFLATLATVVLVANYWGYSAALRPAAVAATVCLLLALAAGLLQRPLWPDRIRWQAGTACAMGLIVFVIGVFGGGAYMAERFSTGNGDLNTRLDHWKLGMGMLQTPADWWLGKGQGRFPANYFLIGDLKEHPGDYRLLHESDDNYLRLTGGLHVIGWGELLRVSQRVSEPRGPVKVTASVRAANHVGVHFEICEKHLLYNLGCLLGDAAVKPTAGQWQTVHAALQGNGVSRGAWYAPKLLVFSMAMATGGGTADIKDLELTDADGHPLVANGDFSDGMAHWFFSSDRYHLPWHIKNMFLHVLFDQGIVGLALWTMLVGGTLLRLIGGAAKKHPLAPALTASLLGFLTVGLFDSLLDVPRLAMLFYFVVLVGMTIRTAPPPNNLAYRAASAERQRARSSGSKPDLGGAS